MPPNFLESTKLDRIGPIRTSVEEMRLRGWILQALPGDVRSTTPTLVLAIDGNTAVASNDQDREQRKRVQLEKTIDVWDCPAMPTELLNDGTLTIETMSDLRLTAPATEPPASGIPTFRIDRTNILSAPETTVRERERLEWLRIQAASAVSGLSTPNGAQFESPDNMDWSADSLGEMLVARDVADRERRKRIQLEKTLELWDAPIMRPRFSPDAVIGPERPKKLPPIRRLPRGSQRPPLL